VPLGFRERLLSVSLREGEELLGSDRQLLVKAKEQYEYYFVDLHGELAFGGRFFTDAKNFSEGLAAVRLQGYTYTYGGPYGYIDHNGYLTIQPQFKQAGSFSEGLAAVELPFEADDVFNRKWGYIDHKGELVISAQFDSAKPFSAGLAVVSVNRKYGYIDHSGKIVIEPQFDKAENFIDGREVAVVGVGGYWGCIDRTGKFVVEPHLDRIEHHWGNSKTLVMVRMGATKDASYIYEGYEYEAELEGGQCTFMNAAGKLIVPPFDYIGDYPNNFFVNSDGTAFTKVNDKWGWLDANGTCIIPTQFDELGGFKDGLVNFKQGELWGILNYQAEIVIPAKFDMLGVFIEDLAKACQNGSWGFIDLSGEFVVAPEFEEVGDFSEGLASVQINGRWGYIDRSGQIVISCQFKWVCEFKGGLAMACNMSGKSSFINRFGEWLVSPDEFDGCSEFENGAAEVYFK
jgi:hypothetical protein